MSSGSSSFDPSESFDYYQCLGLTPSAGIEAIRQAHRDLSKHYHPDTTRLPLEQARVKFEQLQEAYRVLSDPAQRLRYEQQLGHTRLHSRPAAFQSPVPSRPPPRLSSSAYLDASDRPLSSGELFALFLFGVTIIGCLALAVVLAIARGDALVPPPSWALIELQDAAVAGLDPAWLNRLS